MMLRELQRALPWTIRYDRDFRASPVRHKDFAHALLHVQKAAGKLAAVANDAEHAGSDFATEEVDQYVADMVVCALRMANTCPGRVIDLETVVVDRIETKNGVELPRTPTQRLIDACAATIAHLWPDGGWIGEMNVHRCLAPLAEMRDALQDFARDVEPRPVSHRHEDPLTRRVEECATGSERAS